MKKMVLAILSVIMVTLLGVMTVGCGNEELNMGKECIRYESQLDALTQLNVGSVDVAVIDSVMADYYTTKGEFKNTLMTVDLDLAVEQYGIAGRKEDKALMHMVNKGLIEMAKPDGSYGDIAETYGLKDHCLITENTVDPYANADDDSWSKILARQDKTINIGYTIFAPVAFTNDGQNPKEDGSNLVGFDIALAKEWAACWGETYGIKVNFVKIEWSMKEADLANGTIDLIWNGMTITPERSAEMCISVPYLTNKQIAVIRKEDATKYTSVESMKKAVFGVENGSAGEEVVVK